MGDFFKKQREVFDMASTACLPSVSSYINDVMRSFFKPNFFENKFLKILISK